MTMKIDLNQSTIDGLNSDMKHTNLEINESRELCRVYENKCEVLLKQIADVDLELSSNKREMI
jgi:hypothetical protein